MCERLCLLALLGAPVVAKNCIGTASCQGMSWTMACSGSGTCTQKCKGTGACQANTITCPAGYTCQLDCTGLAACQANTLLPKGSWKSEDDKSDDDNSGGSSSKNGIRDCSFAASCQAQSWMLTCPKGGQCVRRVEL